MTSVDMLLLGVGGIGGALAGRAFGVLPGASLGALGVALAATGGAALPAAVHAGLVLGVCIGYGFSLLHAGDRPAGGDDGTPTPPAPEVSGVSITRFALWAALATLVAAGGIGLSRVERIAAQVQPVAVVPIVLALAAIGLGRDEPLPLHATSRRARLRAVWTPLAGRGLLVVAAGGLGVAWLALATRDQPTPLLTLLAPLYAGAFGLAPILCPTRRPPSRSPTRPYGPARQLVATTCGWLSALLPTATAGLGGLGADALAPGRASAALAAGARVGHHTLFGLLLLSPLRVAIPANIWPRTHAAIPWTPAAQAAVLGVAALAACAAGLSGRPLAAWLSRLWDRAGRRASAWFATGSCVAIAFLACGVPGIGALCLATGLGLLQQRLRAAPSTLLALVLVPAVLALVR
jgi:TctA family transporter